MKTKPTSDDKPLTFKKHPRNTILGASLFLESLFPDLDAKTINRLSPIVAREFQEVIDLNKVYYSEGTV